MKRKSFFSFAVAFVFSILAIPALAQTAKDVFNTQTPIFYFGIDFTKAKLINDAEANEHDIKERQFDGINDLMVNEAKKYDFAGALRRSELPNDLGFVAKRNATIDPDNIKSTSSADYNRLKESDIQEVVKAFDFGNNKGIGLLVVMEGMSKSKKGASMWITFVDISAKKVLFTERMEGKGGMAFGFRNYWAVPIRDVVDEIKKKKYTEWKSKYGG